MSIVSQAHVRALLDSYTSANSQPTAVGAFVPTVEALSRVIDAVFFASLLREEGRSALARVVFGGYDHIGWRVTEPLEVTPKTLKKLSPFMDSPGVSFAVDPQNRIAGIQVGEPTPAMSVFATRPGRVVVAAGLRVMSLFEEGEWHNFDTD